MNRKAQISSQKSADKELSLKVSALEKGKSGISVRALFIGIFLVVVVCFIVSYAELVIGRIQVGFLQMPPAAIGIFFFVVLLNKCLHRIAARFALNAAELIMIYCMIIVAAMVCSRGILEKIIPLLVTPNYFANPSNRWHDLFYPHIKKWLVPFDPELGPGQSPAIRFFEGLRAGETIPWHAWSVPLLAWGVLILLVIFAFLCMATILRRQWVDNEKLSFPLVQPPLELVKEEQGGSILRDKLLWGGMALPVIVFSFNGLHNWFPNIPEITLQLLLNPYLVNPPWDKIYCWWIYVSFAAIGFFFLLPSELIFSLWFFALLARFQDVVAASFGMELERMPVYGTHLFVAYQTAGAYFVLVGYLIYVSLPHLKRVFRTALGIERMDDSNELMPYRVAVWGLLGSFALIAGWSWLAGMSLWVAFLEFGVFLFIIALVMARSTAEAGMLMTETSFRPVDIYHMFAPVHNLGAANMTLLAFFDVAFLRDQRGLLFTGFLDSLKMSDGVYIRRRALLPMLAVGTLTALIVGGFLHMVIPYSRGGIMLYQAVYQGLNLAPFREFESHMAGSNPMDWQAPVFFGVGVIFTLFLSYMRSLFYWWPLHPLGYALCVSWTISVFWFSALVAWIIKVLLLRYGGMRLYVRARPWFLGMVLGEFSMAVLWTLIGALTGAPTPEFPWP